MIKFRCLNCGQKLAVSEEGIGVVVSCTNCAERIVVPPYSITEFLRAEPTPRQNPFVSAGLQLIRPEKARDEVAPTTLRAALVPQLARMMMNRLVQALFSQRENLIDTQTEATQRMAELEERIAKAQEGVQKKIAAYEARIAELERQLVTKENELIVKESEKHELIRANFQLAKKALEAESAPRAGGRVNLRDAGFLLRA
ncbi:MAG: hypothetical protein ACRD5L_12915 [Bryobacteraceae bacterium]